MSHPVQLRRCKERFRDPVAADRFERMLARADEMVTQAAALRRQAWSDYYRATGETPRVKERSPYA